MKKSLLQRILITLTLLFAAMSAASAADRFYMDAVNIEPNETRTIAFYLENENPYFGFQGDLKLPEGLEIVTENGKPSITLSSRADNSFRIVSNTLADGTLRFGTFSTSHSSFSGNSGALLYLKVKAASDFAGGELTVKDILFIGSGDKDIEFPDISMTLSTEHNDKAFIPDFKIEVGEAKQISLELSNETSFTAFQVDVILPEGLTIQENSFRLSQRASDHTISVKSFSDGRTRIACLSLSNAPFSGNTGALVSFTVIADKNIAEKSEMQLKNVIFTMPNAREYTLPDSITEITVDSVSYPESLTLNEHYLVLKKNDTFQLLATVEPIDAVDSSPIVWESSDTEVASVDNDGLVTAISEGEAVVTARTRHYSEVSDECSIIVSKDSGIKVSPFDKASVSIYNKTVIIDGLSVGTIISLTDLNGRVMNRYSYDGHSIEFTVEQSGLYILSLGKYSLKVALQ